jgi:ankyrin repeat protein
LNCIDKFGSTPLRGAMSKRHEDVVQFLKSRGASLYLDSFVQSEESVGSRAFSDHELEQLRVVFNSIGSLPLLFFPLELQS